MSMPIAPIGNKQLNDESFPTSSFVIFMICLALILAKAFGVINWSLIWIFGAFWMVPIFATFFLIIGCIYVLCHSVDNVSRRMYNDFHRRIDKDEYVLDSFNRFVCTERFLGKRSLLAWGMNVALVSLMVILKSTGVIDWSYLYVFIPIWLEICVLSITSGILAITLYKADKLFLACENKFANTEETSPERSDRIFRDRMSESSDGMTVTHGNGSGFGQRIRNSDGTRYVVGIENGED